MREGRELWNILAMVVGGEVAAAEADWRRRPWKSGRGRSDGESEMATEASSPYLTGSSFLTALFVCVFQCYPSAFLDIDSFGKTLPFFWAQVKPCFEMV